MIEAFLKAYDDGCDVINMQVEPIRINESSPSDGFPCFVVRLVVPKDGRKGQRGL